MMNSGLRLYSPPTVQITVTSIALLFILTASLPSSVFAVQEQKVRLLPLAGALQDPKAEISGLAWHKERLILLPQYPDWGNMQRNFPASVFAIAKKDIVSFLKQDHPDMSSPLPMTEIRLWGMEFCRELPGFEGFEAIAILGDRAFLLIETYAEGRMGSWLVQGIFSPDEASLWLEKDSMARLDPPVNLRNMSFEALVLGPSGLNAIFEANGRKVNPHPMALRFDFDMKPLPPVAFPHVEYRITDATTVDDEDRFWVLNYFWPGNKGLLQPAEDDIVRRWGVGKSHANSEYVERILPFEMTLEGPRLADAPPVIFELGMMPRNWEGLALLRDSDVQGFLLATDKFPATMLGFVPLQ